MIKLREYQAKTIFASYGLHTPRGILVDSPAEAERAAAAIAGPVVLKPQLGVKGRSKAGGILFAETPAEAGEAADRLFTMSIKGETVEQLLIEEKISFDDEYYLAVAIDYVERSPLLVASAQGGVDIEEVAMNRPSAVMRIPLTILKEPSHHILLALEEELGADVSHYAQILYRIFLENDAEMVEINPLVRKTDGWLCAVDAVLNLDEAASFRHEEWNRLQKDISYEEPLADEAKTQNWTYIDLPGDIGILSSGAGLTMAILDLIHGEGGEPANFLDTAQMDDGDLYRAFEFMKRAKPVKVLLVNIFAGLNRCDTLAEGIRRYLAENSLDVPLVVRMQGNGEEAGRRILQDLGIEPYSKIEQAVEQAVSIARNGVTTEADSLTQELT
jgi:succinyl-CoA synthetase beta subunit